jgi:serine/threonine protein kinase
LSIPPRKDSATSAPERFTTGIADARADVYSLACMLHESLTGTLPFPGDSAEQQLAGHLTLDPPKPTSLNPAIPAGFDEVIAGGMAKNPDQRYQSASELALAAHRALTEAPAPAQNLHTSPASVTNPALPTPAPGPTVLDDAAAPAPTSEPTVADDPATPTGTRTQPH